MIAIIVTIIIVVMIRLLRRLPSLGAYCAGRSAELWEDMYMYIYIYIYIYIYRERERDVYIYIYIYIFNYIHIYIYIYTCLYIIRGLQLWEDLYINRNLDLDKCQLKSFMIFNFNRNRSIILRNVNKCLLILTNILHV